jgi:hypothetical protein
MGADQEIRQDRAPLAAPAAVIRMDVLARRIR